MLPPSRDVVPATFEIASPIQISFEIVGDDYYFGWLRLRRVR